MKKNLIWAFNIMAIASFVFSSCSDDEDPVAPMISINNSTFTGDIGDDATATISGTLDGAFVSLRISKFIGTTPDATYGTGGVMEVTSGLPYNFSYTLGAEGIDSPIRFNFLVTDANNLTGSTDLIITTEATRGQLLTAFNWRYNSLLFNDPPEEGILECEQDNIYSYETDGTMSLDLGALTGSGGGSCDFDGAVEWAGWEFDDNEEVLTLFREDVLPDGSTVPKDTLKWTIVEFDQTGWSADEESIFGKLTYGYKAEPK